MATHSGILAWETPWTEEPGITGYSGGGYSPGGCKESDTTEHEHMCTCQILLSSKMMNY